MADTETWYLSTADSARHRLFPRGIVALFAFCMVLVGWLALPGQQLHQRLGAAHESDLLTVAYLNAWMNASPDDWQLRLTLARNQALIGRHREALKSIDLLLTQGPTKLRPGAQRLRLNVLERSAYELPENHPRRTRLLRQVGQTLGRLAAATNDPAELEAYLRRAEGLGDTALAASLISRLPRIFAERSKMADGSVAQQYQRLTGRPIEDLADKAIALGDFRLAAELYWQAFDSTEIQAQRLNLLMQASRAEQAGNRLDEFFTAFEARENLVQLDNAAYKRLARLALAANRLELAERLARQMLQFSGWWASWRLADAGLWLRMGWQQMLRSASEFSLIASAQAASTTSAIDPLNNTARPRKVNRKPRPVAPQVRVNVPNVAQPPNPTPVSAPAPVSAPVSAPMAPVTAPVAAPAPVSVAEPVAKPLPAQAQTSRPRPAPPPAALAHNWDTAAAAASPDGQRGRQIDVSPQFENGKDFNLLFETLGEQDVENALPKRTGPGNQYRTAHESAGFEPGSMPQSSYDEESWQLAYQVFLARGNLDDAYAVAYSAVKHDATNQQWLERLAQVAEWSQRPIAALENWLLLAQRSQREAHWHNVKRLAAELRDEPRSIEYLRWHLSHSPDDYKEAINISRAFERQGEVAQATRWLESYLANNPKAHPVQVLTEIANIAERNRDPDTMIDALSRASTIGGPAPERAVRIASAQYVRGRLRLAFEALSGTEAVASDPLRYTREQEESIQYWATYAELSRQLNMDQEALLAYRQLVSLDAVKPAHLEALASNLEHRSFDAAAQVMEHAWFKYQQPRYAERAVALYLRNQNLNSANAFLLKLKPSLRNQLTREISFLKQRASIYQSSALWALARQDLLKVHQKTPDDMDNRAALIWLLLAEKNATGLRSLLKQWDKLAVSEAALWGPYGAALLSLGDTEAALPFFVRQARQQQDYLWWLAYADALEASGRADPAWSLRRRAWLQMRNIPQGRQQENPETRDRIVALAMRFSPPDEAQALLRDLLNKRPKPTSPRPISQAATSQTAARPNATLIGLIDQNRINLGHTPASGPAAIPADSRQAATARHASASELAVSYLFSQEAIEPARAWLLQRYASQLAQPAWARLSLALSTNDRTALEHLLATTADWLPQLDRTTALTRLGRIAEAQTHAFNTLDARESDQRAHQKLVETIVTDEAPAGFSARASSVDVIDQKSIRADGTWRLGQHSKWWIFGEKVHTSSADDTVLRNANIHGHRLGLGFGLDGNSGSYRVELSRRKMMASSTGLLAHWQQSGKPLMNLSLSLGVNQPSAELAALSVGGQQDYLRASARFSLTARDYIDSSLQLGRLESQLGTKVANARQIRIEAGHHFRLDYPELSTRISLTRSLYESGDMIDPVIASLAPSGSESPLAWFVPASSHQIDMFLSAGQSAQDGYTRAIRPFGEAGFSYNNESAWGYSVRAGVSTSVLGTDTLTFYGAYTSKSPGNTHGSRELGLSYRMLR